MKFSSFRTTNIYLLKQSVLMSVNDYQGNTNILLFHKVTLTYQKNQSVIPWNIL